MALPPHRARNIASMAVSPETPQGTAGNISAAIRGIGMTAEEKMIQDAVGDRMDFIKRELSKNPNAEIGKLMATPTRFSGKSEERFMGLVAENLSTDIRAQMLGVVNRGRVLIGKAQNHGDRDAAGRKSLMELEKIYKGLPVHARRQVADNYLSGLQSLAVENESAREQITTNDRAIANSNFLREIRSSVRSSAQEGNISGISGAVADGVKQVAELAKTDKAMARRFGEQLDGIRGEIRGMLDDNDALDVFFEGLDPLTNRPEIKTRFGALAAAGGLMHFDAALEKYEKHAVPKRIVEQEFAGIISGRWDPSVEAHRENMAAAANRARGIMAEAAKARGWNEAEMMALVGDEARAQTSHISPVSSEKKNRNRAYIASFSLANGEYMAKLLNAAQQGQKPDGALMSTGPAPKWPGDMTESDLNEMGDMFSDRTGLLQAWGFDVDVESAFDDYTKGLGADDKIYLRNRALNKQSGMVMEKRAEYSDEVAAVERLQGFMNLPLQFGGDGMKFVFPDGSLTEKGELSPALQATLHEAGKAIDADDPTQRETYARILRSRSPSNVGALAANAFRNSFAPRRDAPTVANEDLARLNVAPGRADVSRIEIQNAPFQVRMMSAGGRGSVMYPAMVEALVGQFPENEAKVPVGEMGAFQGAEPNEVHAKMKHAPVAVLAQSGKFDRWRIDNKYAAEIPDGENGELPKYRHNFPVGVAPVHGAVEDDMLYANWFSQNELTKRIESSGAFGPDARWSILIQKEEGRVMWILAPTDARGEPLRWDTHDNAILGYVLRQTR